MKRALIVIGSFLLAAAAAAGFAAPPAAPIAPAAPGSPAPSASAPLSAEQERFFENRVRPILVARCQSCHGATKQESGLRLDSRAALLRGGETGEPVLLLDRPDQSRFLAAVRRQGELKMPPEEKNRLSAEEVETLTLWVKQGAPWPKAAEAAFATQEELYSRARAEHWSMQKIARPTPPATKNSAAAAGAIDRFVLARLEGAGLTISPPADRVALLRRVFIDLVGLPPTPEEADDFLSDSRSDAYERLVDRLLASPRYGERWGRHWLDVARYADTRGYAFQRDRRFPYAYTYRDYVIRAFNSDLPYDRFLLEQLAADQLPQSPDRASLAGLGFLTVGRKFDNQPEDIDEQIDVVCRGLLGLTAGCARCHDHKYDPIPSEDYYSLYGVFASTEQPGDDLPVIGDPHATPGYDAFAAELEKRRAAVADVANQCRTKAEENGRQHAAAYLARIVSPLSDDEFQKQPFATLKGGDFKAKMVERWRNYLAAHARPEDPVFGPWSAFSGLSDGEFAAKAPEVLARLAALKPGQQKGEINPLIRQALTAAPPLASKVDLAQRLGGAFAAAYAQYTKAGGAPAALAALPGETQQLVHVLIDADSPCVIPPDEMRAYFTRVDSEKERDLKRKVIEHEASAAGAPPRAMIVRDRAHPVEPHVLLRGKADRPGKQVPRQFLHVLSGDNRKPFSKGSGRLEMAQAIVSSENPLTARVLVNRLWLAHFGRGLVATASDFGLKGQPPSHPELLDYLASRLQETGWSIKALQREIILSSVYRQSAFAGAQTDAAFAVDPENRLLWRMNRRRLEFEALRDSLFFVAGNLRDTMYGRPADFTTPAFNRRAVYGFIDRQDLPNLLRVFDFASPDSSSPGRPHTVVPQQSLFLMNSPVVVEQARRLANRPDVNGVADPVQRIVRLNKIVFARPPAAEEIKLAQDFLQAAQSDSAKINPWEQYAQLLLLSNEFAYTD